MMKNLIIFIALIWSVMNVQGQTEFGFKAGVNFPSYSFADSDKLADTKTLTSFYLAGYLDSRIAQGLYFHPEVSLQGKGSRLIESQILGGTEIIQKTMWLDFPFNFLGKVPVGNMGDVFVGGGPYIGFAIDGTNTYASGNTTAVIIYDDNALKTVDYGINFLVSVKVWKRFLMNANYRMGWPI